MYQVIKRDGKLAEFSIGKITDKREHYHNVNVPATDLMCEKFEF